MTENGEQHHRDTPGNTDHSAETAPGHSEPWNFSDGGTSASRGPLSYLADVVAGINLSVHAKLLAGYLAGALLVLGMSILTLVVISNMNHQVSELTRLQNQVESATKKSSLVASQLDLMALALLTNDDSHYANSAAARREFSEVLALAESKGRVEQAEFFQRLREANDRFATAGAQVLAQSGNPEEAIRIHIEEERPISVEVEQLLAELVSDANTQMKVAQTGFQSDRRLLSTLGWTFSGVGLAGALLIGFVMSLAFIRPVRRINSALAQIAVGDFTQRVVVPNRDEFGTLSTNLNRTTERLGQLYTELHSLNQNLQTRVDQQVQELERSTRMKRYLSPQLAESILSGGTDVDLSSRRQELTIFFSDIRGFTAMSERLEPEELVDMLNQYLAEMTEIVFRHGGTLDKYIGDALMVFFGNPVPYEDHAQRAVMTALEMRARLEELQQRWVTRNQELLTMGIGITTGYVTVGNIGSAARLDYTVLGNQVNLASRLADEAKGGQILVSERTVLAAGDMIHSTEIDSVQLKGVSRPIRIFEINDQ